MEHTDLPDNVMANLLEPPEADETILTRWSSYALTDSPAATLGRGLFADLQPPEVNARTVARHGDARPADYLVVGTLGEGGMGIVFDAEQVYFGRRVALKMIKPALAPDPAATRAFFREAVITSRLNHPGVIPILDFGVSQDGRALYAMTKAGGIPWHRVMRDKTLAENLAILDRVADVVSYAHDRGILHRDIKPANVLLGDHGEVWLGDWGVALARLPDGTYSHARPAGTPQYMAPEMARCDAANLGPASDIYLLGAVLFEILTGRPPHSGNTSAESLLRAAANNVRTGANSHELMPVALRAMSMEPHQRFSSVRNFQRAIQECLDDRVADEHVRNGKELLAQARKEEDYDLFTRAISLFEQALAARPDNSAARSYRIKAIIAYSTAACDRGEYALARTALQSLPRSRHAAEQLDKIDKAERKTNRRKRNSRAFAVAGILILLGMIGYSVRYYYIQQRNYRNFANTSVVRHDRMMQDEFYLLGEIRESLRILRNMGFASEAEILSSGKRDRKRPANRFHEYSLRVHTIVEPVLSTAGAPDISDLKAFHAFCRRVVVVSEDLRKIKNDIEANSSWNSNDEARKSRDLAARLGRALEYMDAYREKYLGAKS